MAKIKKKGEQVWIEGDSKFKFLEYRVIAFAKGSSEVKEIFFRSPGFRMPTKRINDAFRRLVEEYRKQKPEMYI